MSEININSNLYVNNQKIKKFYKQMLKPVYLKYNFTQNELDVIMFLHNNPSFTTAKDIVEIRGLAKSHVCKSVSNLTKNGYITERFDEHDKRCIHLSLTDKVKDVVAAASKLQVEFFEILYKNITAEEKNVIANVHKKMFENVEDMLEK